ncbi:unnamed protein product [Vitrella brassicaformis CCMP3155]|uniref:Uncharacterized protein n=1 Tax=Vitrella brassicaformis (strain CCMP3155) TaxID=1169540 RepID=A0A0G4GZE7_VITBC|nr:unnamed protein product [Vitrella brassicaformis CCMP3155]|eukprot:CEM36457.1 unnamed protein product [Vitrella brassicaformis CCMP3155]
MSTCLSIFRDQMIRLIRSTLSSSISPGIPLNDLQLNLSYVVDELVMRQRLYEQRMKDEGILAEDSGGWQGLYGAFKKAKKALTEAGRQEVCQHLSSPHLTPVSWL